MRTAAKAVRRIAAADAAPGLRTTEQRMTVAQNNPSVDRTSKVLSQKSLEQDRCPVRYKDKANALEDRDGVRHSSGHLIPSSPKRIGCA